MTAWRGRRRAGLTSGGSAGPSCWSVGTRELLRYCWSTLRRRRERRRRHGRPWVGRGTTRGTSEARSRHSVVWWTCHRDRTTGTSRWGSASRAWTGSSRVRSISPWRPPCVRTVRSMRTGCARRAPPYGLAERLVRTGVPEAASGWGSCSTPLAEYHDVLLLDLDGVVYVGPQAVPGAPEALELARRSGARLAYVTNNAARTPDVVARHLTDLGVPAEPTDVVTSAQAAAAILAAE